MRTLRKHCAEHQDELGSSSFKKKKKKAEMIRELIDMGRWEGVS